MLAGGPPGWLPAWNPHNQNKGDRMENFDLKNATAEPPPPMGTPGAEERQWAMFAHLSALVGGIVTSGWGANLGFFVGPLIIWLMKKDTMPFVNDQAREALNFAITVSLACAALLLVTIMTIGIGALLTIPLMAIIGIAALVFIIMGAVKANQGIAYRYPFALRLVK
jgi:uncharacterized protein